jgi:hypothetical protein
MTRHSSAARLLLAALALLGLGGPASAGEQVPFLGRLEGAFTNVVISVDPPIRSVLTSGVGEATHLGEFTFEIRFEVNLATLAATGSIHFVAANGDRLDATFVGQGGQTQPGVLAVVETATVTGGTGRFANATGSFTVERLIILATSTTTGSFDGTISSPGAAR